MAIRFDHRADELDEMHEINVTPFIDVMLVLLIIFMIAAPLATADIAVNLPTINAERAPQPDKPLTVTLRPNLALTLNDKAVARDNLAAALEAATESSRKQRIYLRADKAVPYGDLMNIMNALRSAGYLDVALVGLEGAPAP
jgi:biopolymer transport protein ExbD